MPAISLHTARDDILTVYVLPSSSRHLVLIVPCDVLILLPCLPIMHDVFVIECRQYWRT